MTTYNASAVSDSIIAHKKGITLQQGRALRDNPIAMAEGAAGAPRIAIGALQRLEAGSEIRSRWDAEISAALSTGSFNGLTFGFLQAGEVRVSYDARRGNGVNTSVQVVRVRNAASAILKSDLPATSWTSYSLDVTVLPGDQVYIRHLQNGGSDSVYLRNQRISTAGQDLYPGQPAPLEGNTYA